MEEYKTLIGAALFIGLVIGANFIMYAIARGATRPGGGGFLETITKALTSNPSKKKDEMEELRRSVRELTQNGDDAEKQPE
ncbi:MAG: hypothetical protein DCC59_17810 [Chloroflexi bacterium]|nr:hypothetical protein [Anaerolineales bacterium]RIK45634.1 MAG: hypothetical protein DCC59_17810 [Chloroflexota bacterium]